MGKKITRGNRVQRFRDWSPEHKQAVLDRLGISLDDFRSYGGSKKQRVLNRALDGQNPSGGGSEPSTPAFDRNDPAAFTAPMSYNQVLHQGRAAADLRYGPDQRLLQQQAVNIPSWFDQYRNSLTAAQTQQQQMTQPMLDQTTQRADNAGKPVLQDATGQVQQDDVLAAAGRKALIDAGLAALQGTAAATQGYLAGRVGVANAAQQQALTDNTTAQRQVAADRGDFLTNYVGTARETERRNGLEAAAFGLDQYKAQTDAAEAGSKTNKWGYTADEWSSFSAGKRERIIRRQSGYGKGGSKGPSAKDLAMYDVNGNGKLDPGEYANRPGKGGGKPPTVAAQKTSAKIRQGVALVRKHDNGLPQYWREAFDRLVEQDGLDPIIARAIVNGARTGRVGPKTAKALLKEYGISSITIPGKPHRPKPTTISRPPNASDGNGQSRPT